MPAPVGIAMQHNSERVTPRDADYAAFFDLLCAEGRRTVPLEGALDATSLHEIGALLVGLPARLGLRRRGGLAPPRAPRPRGRPRDPRPGGGGGRPLRVRPDAAARGGAPPRAAPLRRGDRHRLRRGALAHARRPRVRRQPRLRALAPLGVAAGPRARRGGPAQGAPAAAPAPPRLPHGPADAGRHATRARVAGGDGDGAAAGGRGPHRGRAPAPLLQPRGARLRLLHLPPRGLLQRRGAR